MILVVEVLMLLAGLGALINGSFPLRRGYASGFGARLAGLVLMLPLLVCFIIGFIEVSNARASGLKISFWDMFAKYLVLELCIIGGCAVVAYLIADMSADSSAGLYQGEEVKTFGDPIPRHRPRSRGVRQPGDELEEEIPDRSRSRGVPPPCDDLEEEKPVRRRSSRWWRFSRWRRSTGMMGIMALGLTLLLVGVVLVLVLSISSCGGKSRSASERGHKTAK